MTQAEFRDALRILRSIKRWEIEDAGVFNDEEGSDLVWPISHEHRVGAFLFMPDSSANKVWSIVERRMRQRPHTGATDALGPKEDA